MPHRAPRILTLLLATAGACLAASGAQAQVQAQAQAAPAAGRYLTWANRPAGTTPADVAAVQAQARTAMIPRRVAPSQAPYRPMLQPTSMPLPASRGLTPASAWLGPRVVPAYAPGSPDPMVYATTEIAPPAPVYSPPSAPVERAAVDPMAPRRDAPVFNMQRQAAASTAQASAPQQAPQSVAADPNDPMAPRRDARIFQMQQGPPQGQEQAALPAPTPQAPSTEASVQAGQSGARYYSVHRDAGHRPDPTALPEPVYFDSVTLDLAEPPENEPQMRDAQGRRRVVPNADPSLP
ncbi:hypothetical protein [Brevundimonas sp.]|uniref:hypothetical protein n=1 Tax=Brevundimonas sp. TaxID=1871086 RepID=UPI00286B7C31|nr:hypothetical protein [Brevundimonas sp.]